LNFYLTLIFFSIFIIKLIMMKKYRTLYLLILILGLGFYAFPDTARSEIQIHVKKVADNIYCFNGFGGNMVILKGQKGLLVVDAKFAQSGPVVMKKIEEISPLPIQFLINTHYHSDHTSGNPIVGKGAWIVSQQNCQKSLIRRLKPDESAELMGIPHITYLKKLSLLFETEPVLLEWFGSAHTSGDTVVIFERSKVIHTGDLFFNGSAAYIDVKDGSKTQNWIYIIKKLALKYSDFIVIPGHGPISNMREWLEFAEYLQFLRNEVLAAIKAGKSREQAMETISLEKYKHLKDKGNFITKKNNIGWVYDELTRK